MAFNEDSRVKIPALLHLTRLGYKYLSRKEHNKRQEETNIFPEMFNAAISRINPDAHADEINKLLQELALKLDFEDLGQAFFNELTKTSGIKLIDFTDFRNNTFHVTTELTCKNGDEEFRPDITVLINGMPLVFIEVKKPNNKEGVIAERKRINARFQNKKFRRFSNITQLMIFSNNMQYEDGVVEPLMGAYYGTVANREVQFNYFREEEKFNYTHLLAQQDPAVETEILRDNGMEVIRHNAEFISNKHYHTPTNEILSSMLSNERLAFILNYAIAYVEEEADGRKEMQKHIMRYPQIFACKAIERKLDAGMTKGIIWHTQGSGKTALAFYNVKFLTNYYQKRGVIPKFYFVVDRIDLAIQASSEFTKRGLRVNAVNTRQDFVKDLQTVGAIHNASGQAEISVINIQKFSEEAVVLNDISYDLNIQRIYFLDEAHRSYNPKGNYLANLINSDKKAIKIALTGTPLLKEVVKDYDSKKLFGEYIHKYYYNRSIADGYTLRLIREGIDTNYKMQMKEILSQFEVLKGDLQKKLVYAHPKYTEPLLDYILDDLYRFRYTENDDSLGAMVVCDSSEQAKSLFKVFEKRFGEQETNVANLDQAAEPIVIYGITRRKLRAAIILHDVNDKAIRKDLIEVFKKGKIDILFVYNMLLTGFDAKRLKKLYLARIVKDHNLLQTLTRVNRPYKHYKFGYVVDFADITGAFDRTNRLYYDELQAELGDEMESYSRLFKSPEEIEADIQHIHEKLFAYDTLNAENFSNQLNEIRDKKTLHEIVKALRTAKELKNIIRLEGHNDLLEKLDFFKLTQLLNVAEARLSMLNEVEAIQNGVDANNLIHAALEDIYFVFTKVSEKELVLADELKSWLRKTREGLQDNFDPEDPRFVSLREELERIFKKKNMEEVSQDEMQENITWLKAIYDKVRELNRQNYLLKVKYEHDEKYVRVHKRLKEKNSINMKDTQLYDALMVLKRNTDEELVDNKQLVENEGYFQEYMLQLVVKELKKEKNIPLDFETAEAINTLLVNEYLNQYNGQRV